MGGNRRRADIGVSPSYSHISMGVVAGRELQSNKCGIVLQNVAICTHQRSSEEVRTLVELMMQAIDVMIGRNWLALCFK